MEEFGIDSFPVNQLPQNPRPPRLFRRNIVFGQRGFSYVLDRMKNREPFAVMSGLMPSGKMHLGHKMVIDQIKYFQDFGARVFVGVADLEAYGARGVELKASRKLAIDSYIKNYLALGLGRGDLEIYFQSKRTMVKDLSFILGRKVNYSTMKAIYGFGDSTNLSHMNSPLIQSGDILHPQIKMGPVPVVVPVGIDQDPHIRLCRDLAFSFRIFNVTTTKEGEVGVFLKVDRDVEKLLSRARTRMERLGFLDFKMVPRYKAMYVMGATPSDMEMMNQELALLENEMGEFGFIPPASTYHRFIRGLTGEKMSSSKPDTAIFLDDNPEEAEKKLKKSITGGRETAEEQRRKGGRPHLCSVFESMLFHTVEDEKEISRVERECIDGERLCGYCKKEAIEHMKTFLKDLHEKREEKEHLVDDFLKDD